MLQHAAMCVTIVSGVWMATQDFSTQHRRYPPGRDRSPDTFRARDGESYAGRLLRYDGRNYTWLTEGGRVVTIEGNRIGSVILLEDSPSAPPPPAEPSPMETTWADRVVAYRAGDPQPVSEVQQPEAALGRPDYDEDHPNRGYVSLGHGGELIVAFRDRWLVDREGDDLVIVELGGFVEPVDVWVSENGRNWAFVGSIRGDRNTIDIWRAARHGERFAFVRLRDSRAGYSNDSDWPGADIDAVGAIHSTR